MGKLDGLDPSQKQLKEGDTGSSKRVLENVLGAWARDPERLAAMQGTWAQAQPFEHLVIDNFLSEDVAETLAKEFPAPDADMWFRYDNPIEKKLLQNFLHLLPSPHEQILRDLCCEEVVKIFSGISKIDLEADPWLHGAGIHSHPPGGKLDVHLDYSIHPYSGKERRMNLILYLNHGWEEAWGGCVELYNAELSPEGRQVVVPKFNRAVVFRTCDVSYHGLPTPVASPQGQCRNSVAVYYVSDPRPEAEQRFKAQYKTLSGQACPEKRAELQKIRTERRITTEDLERIWPDWEKYV